MLRRPRLPLPRPLPGAGKRPRWKAPKRIVAETIEPGVAAAPAPRQDAAVFTPDAAAQAGAVAGEAIDAAAVARMPARETVDEITALRAERDAATAETAKAHGAIQFATARHDSLIAKTRPEATCVRPLSILKIRLLSHNSIPPSLAARQIVREQFLDQFGDSGAVLGARHNVRFLL